MTKLSTLLDQIDSGMLLLPEFQRGYVWNRDQVRRFMRSLYLDYPVGGLLLWETDSADASIRGGTVAAGNRVLLLDGQQRITTLYGVIRGHAPDFFDGDEKAFAGLYFNVKEERFQFYTQSQMAGDPTWVCVTDLFAKGAVQCFATLKDQPDALLYLDRLNQLHQIRDREFHAETITGKGRSVEEVVDIFNQVNSGGTVLSKGDLALATICARWPDARRTMREHLNRWEDAGFTFRLDWLLRNVTAVVKGRAMFSALDDVSAAEFEHGLDATARYLGHFLDAVSSRLGLDHNRVLMGRGGIPAISRLLHLSGGRFTDASQRDRALYWYVNAGLRGRFAGSTETVLQQDYEAVERGGVDGLIDVLERWRGGHLDIQPYDFDGSYVGSRFYPLLYMLTRVTGARDLLSGLELRAEMLGHLSSLQVHHLFPKALLTKVGLPRGQVNAIANFCFLTQDSNLVISDRRPEEYLAEMEERNPGVLASQWIPTDPELWKLEWYLDFLAARRELLAEAAGSFLTALREGSAPAEPAESRPVNVTDPAGPADAAVNQLVETMVYLGYAKPELDAEITDPDSGEQLAVAEAYWPDGLQPGLGSPVVLELDPDSAKLDRVKELGHLVFTSVESLLGYVNRRPDVEG